MNIKQLLLLFFAVNLSSCTSSAGEEISNGVLKELKVAEKSICRPGNKEPLWQLELRDKAGNFHTLTPFNKSEKFTCTESGITKKDTVLSKRYEIKNSDKLVLNFDILISKKENTVDFNYAVSELSDQYVISKVFYPLYELPVIGDNAKNDSVLLPTSFGQIKTGIHAAKAKRQGRGKDQISAVTRNRYPSKNTALQMIFYHNFKGNGGWLIMTPDKNRLTKEFIIDRPAKNARLAVINYPRINKKSLTAFNSEYPVSITWIDGDWYDAAQVYRKWAMAQWWCRNNLAEKETTPEWFARNAHWVRIPQDPGVERDRKNNWPLLWLKETGIAPAVHWYGWDVESGPYNNSFMLWHNPHRKTAAFLKKYHENGIHAMPYTNARIVSFDDPKWNEYESIAVKDSDGSFSCPEKWKSYVTEERYYKEIEAGKNGKAKKGRWWVDFHFANGCTATKKWQDRVIFNTTTLINKHNFDGVYQDQIISWPMICYNENHPHIKGDPWAWREGIEKIYRQIRKNFSKNKKKKVIFSEYISEATIPWIDGGLTIGSKSLMRHRSVPLFSAVYHSNFATIGWSAPLFELKEAPDNYLFMVMMPLVYGGQMGWISYDIERLLEEKNSSIRKCYISGVKLRAQYSDYLGFGKMLRPPEFQNIEMKEVPRRSKRMAIYPYPYPVIISGFFKHGKGKNKAIAVFCNWTSKEQQGQVKIDLSELSLPLKAAYVKGNEINNCKPKLFETEIKMPPHSVKAILFE